MKVFEKNVLSKLRAQVQTFMDPFQFAYSQKRGVDDALLCLLNPIYKHLETKGSSVRIMFYDFSSAFNTIQPHLLAKKLINMDVFPSFILWILDYLTERPQFVKVKDSRSDVLKTNTGAPQGTVLSPFLFSIYTSDCRSSSPDCPISKFADDTAMAGLKLHQWYIILTSKPQQECLN